MSEQKKLVGLVAVCLVSLMTLAVEHFKTPTQTESLPISRQAQPSREALASLDTSRIWTQTRDMTSAQNATHHFEKHGHEFGFKSEAEYVAAAIKFTTEPLPSGVIKNIQKDDDTAYYNAKTAEYAVKSKRGRIRTYFKLDPRIHGYKSNTDYFNAHAKVGSGGVANDNMNNNRD